MKINLFALLNQKWIEWNLVNKIKLTVKDYVLRVKKCSVSVGKYMWFADHSISTLSGHIQNEWMLSNDFFSYATYQEKASVPKF